MINIIVAMDRNGLIGRNGDLPWRLPADLAYFKEKTLSHPIIMGRKTWESLPKKPLPERPNIVLTRNKDYRAPGAFVADNFGSAVRATRTLKERFVIGGSDIFELALPKAKKLYITHIEHEFEGDTYFPDIDWENWERISCEEGIVDENNPYPHRFCIYRRG